MAVGERDQGGGGQDLPLGAESVSSAQAGSSGDTTTVIDTVASDGQFSVTVPTPLGGDTIAVAVATGSHSSGWAQETVTGS